MTRNLDNLDQDYLTAKNSHERVRKELLEIIELLEMEKMEKNHNGFQEEQPDMLKYKLWIELLQVIYQKEIDHWFLCLKNSLRAISRMDLKDHWNLLTKTFAV